MKHFHKKGLTYDCKIFASAEGAEEYVKKAADAAKESYHGEKEWKKTTDAPVEILAARFLAPDGIFEKLAESCDAEEEILEARSTWEKEAAEICNELGQCREVGSLPH